MPEVYRALAGVLSRSFIRGRYCLLRLDAPQISLAVQPGQFVMVLPPGGVQQENAVPAEGLFLPRRVPFLRRPLSVHRIHHREEQGEKAARDGSFSILFEIVGPGTSSIASCRQGGRLDVLGPLGRGYDLSDADEGTECVLVAGGIGVASMHALAEALAEKKARITLLIGAKSIERLPLEVEGVQNPPGWRSGEFADLGVRLEIITETGDLHRQGIVTDLLPEILGKLQSKRTRIFACGPWEMLKETARMAAQRDVPCRVLLEEMMGCGIGACLSCACRTKKGMARVCVDGPAFDARSVDWDAR